MSAMSITGPMAASAAVNASITSAWVRAAHQSRMTASSASRLAIRPANVVKRASSPTPSKASTRWATLSALVDTPTHLPSLQR